MVPTAARVGPGVVRDYLRQKDGLRKLSAVVGNVVLIHEEEIWGNDSIASLTRSSDSVVQAYVSGSMGSLSQDGDSVDTHYLLSVVETLKGASLQQLSFTASGGQVTFPSGHTATVQTSAWNHLKDGDLYIFFLKSSPSGYRLTNGGSEILSVNSVKQQVRLLTPNPKAQEQLSTQVAGGSLASIESEIHNAAVPD